MSQVDVRLQELGITLCEPPDPAGAYVPVVTAGYLTFLSGMLPLQGGQLCCKGRLGDSVSLDMGRDAARLCMVNGLAALKGALGDLDRIERIVRLEGFVNSTPEFHEQHLVMNEASEFLNEVFGDKGRHTRFAVGATSLPLDAPVEISMVVKTGDT
ncbi:RidA family protein [Candidatus Hydrogenedentota bacterium]